MRNYNKTQYINAKGDDYTMSNEAIRETLISLARNLGGKKLKKATVRLASIAPDCEFDIENARFTPRMSSLLIMDYGRGQEGLNIPASDIKTIDHRQYGNNHVIHVCDLDNNCTVVDLWVA